MTGIGSDGDDRAHERPRGTIHVRDMTDGRGSQSHAVTTGTTTADASAVPAAAGAVRRARPQGIGSGRTRFLGAAGALLLLLAACAGDGEEVEEVTDTEVEATEDAPDEEDAATEPDDDGDADDEQAAEEPEPEPEPAVDPAEVGADELGVVPVLMYHQLREDGGSVYDMTAEEYRQELRWLFDNDYRPITVTQLVRREIDVPAGTKPVVLTYDDSTASQAQLTADGELDPETSLGILVEIAAEYEDVEPRASVYVITSSLFGGTGDGEEILRVLHEHGMEIGNHTHNHPNLRNLGNAEVQDELAMNVAMVADLVPDAEVATLSLPLGVFPEDRSLAASGSSEAGSYEHEGILLVGANPAPSPFDAEFDPLAIPRIRSNVDPDAELESTWWLEVIEAGGSNRPYVSDGNPETISFPADSGDRLDPEFEDRANPY